MGAMLMKFRMNELAVSGSNAIIAVGRDHQPTNRLIRRVHLEIRKLYLALFIFYDNASLPWIKQFLRRAKRSSFAESRSCGNLGRWASAKQKQLVTIHHSNWFSSTCRWYLIGLICGSKADEKYFLSNSLLENGKPSLPTEEIKYQSAACAQDTLG